MLTIQKGTLSMQANSADVAPTALGRVSKAAPAGAAGNSPGRKQKQNEKAAFQGSCTVNQIVY